MRSASLWNFHQYPSVCLGFLAVAVGKPSKLCDHRRRFLGCRYLLISEGIALEEWSAPGAMFVGRATRLWQDSRSQSVNLSAIFYSVVLHYTWQWVQNVKRCCKSTGTILIPYHSLGDLSRESHQWGAVKLPAVKREWRDPYSWYYLRRIHTSSIW